MMSSRQRPDFQQLGRRERQILDILYQLGEASAVEVMERLPESPSNATVRKWLSLMEDKDLVTHRQEGKRYIYRPATPHRRARRSALDHLVTTFFKGNRLRAAAALISEETDQLSEEERRLFEEMIEQLRKPRND
ncbi:MAG TPA: BlaI/MecI/CopY family transcriptional regulator [Acidobacteriota bacterium]|nr:BlaI/MecI/CopY family transcriptional regulator [Acidobacteriota bacterium]